MSIVSPFIDVAAVPRLKHGPVKAVGFKAGAPQYPQFALPEQKPFFNISKGIAKPFVPSGMKKYAPGVVPLKSMQYGTHAGAELFNAPMMIDIEPLKTPMPIPTRIRVEDATQEVNPSFPVYTYNDGIRPSMRPLKPEDILEPTGPAFRPSRPVYSQTKTVPFPAGYLPDDEIVRQVRAL